MRNEYMSSFAVNIDFSFCRFLHQYIVSLELDNKVETLETINEKIRKRFKNPKLSNSFSAKVGRHASLAWCRALITSLASITPLVSSAESQAISPSFDFLENRRVLCVDLKSGFWNSSFENPSESQMLEAKWGPVLSKIKNVLVANKVSEENLEMANSLLKSCYNYFRETASVTLPSEINLYFALPRLATAGKLLPGTEGVEVIDVSTPRKLLLWAYTLFHGHCGSISQVVKYMEENTKVRKTSMFTILVSSPLPAKNRLYLFVKPTHLGYNSPIDLQTSKNEERSDNFISGYFGSIRLVTLVYSLHVLVVILQSFVISGNNEPEAAPRHVQVMVSDSLGGDSCGSTSAPV
ncbi:hypothetical protein F2Q70_00034064 [Brassica cretica]|uniref:Uncharacterized protein n=1 Tax=Brassica cretica TaxID=69181 RepID=A0A8S9JWP2_BRACR|nr:hypothetical protein F2Q70_00034064 [Brassica cretica]